MAFETRIKHAGYF